VLNRILLYLFPIFLVALEFVFRGTLSLSDDSRTFLGPTLAAAGLGLILPLVVPKRSIPASDELKARYGNVSIVDKRDKFVIDLSWIFVFVCTAAWVYSLSLSCRQKDVLWWQFPCYIYPGFFNYAVGIILTEIKDKV
jgi:hypothetical protein